MVQRKTLLNYFCDYFLSGEEIAFTQVRGLRRVRWSYQQIGQASKRWASRLSLIGVAKGDRVLLWSGNSAEWVAAFYGCLLRGAVVVPLDIHSEPGFIERVQRQVGAKVLLADSECQARLPPLNTEILTLDAAPDIPELSAWVQSAPDDLVEIVFTSGTTGEPRGVCLSHRNLLANLLPIEREIQKYLRWERWFHPLRFLNLVPLSHVFGQFMGIFVPQMLKAEVHFQGALNPGEVIETLRRQHISVVVSVPRFLDSLKELLERDHETHVDANNGTEPSLVKKVWQARRLHQQLGWKCWAFVCGGATLRADTEAFWRSKGFALVQGYGMTETAALVAVTHPFRQKSRSIGKMLPGRELRIGEGDEVLVRGESIAAGVWSNGVVPLTDAEGWLHTGDIARSDASGHLYFQGRQKEVIVTSAGMNVYPDDLEAALNRQPEVHRSSIVGIETKHGPEPVAVIVLRRNDTSAAQAVKRANDRLASHQQIRRWYVWPGPDLPRTPTLKVRKPVLVDWVKAQQAQTERALPTSTYFGTTPLAQLVARVSGMLPQELDRFTRLDTDLKLDSLGRVELLSLLEQEFQVDIDEARMSDTTTLGDLESLLKVPEFRWGEASVHDFPNPGGSTPHSEGEKIWEGNGLLSEALLNHSSLASEQRPYPYPHWSLSAPARFLRSLLYHGMVWPITQVLCRVQIGGQEFLDSLDRPALFVANHVTYADPGLILAALPMRFRNRMAIAMDGERIRSWRFPPLQSSGLKGIGHRLFYYFAVLMFNLFPLPQRTGFRRSFAFAGNAMDRGYNLLVFPEGRLTHDGRINSFRNGIGLLAKGLDAFVVPVGLDGLFQLKQQVNGRWWRLLRCRARLSVTFGNPFRLNPQEEAGVVTRRIEEAVVALLSTSTEQR